jgi:toxin ParE1/3/4
MTVRWTQPAQDDFLGIVAWIAANNPAAAARVGRRILDTIERLDEFPMRGRPGRSPGTRELVISGLPYLAVYSVDSTDPRTLVILRVLARGHAVAARQDLRRGAGGLSACAPAAWSQDRRRAAS